MASPREAASDKGPEASRRYPELFQRSCEVLKSLDWKDPGWRDAEAALELSDANRLLEPGYLPFEDGYARLPDGSIHCAVLTPMPRVRGEMVSWWFNYCEDSARYQLWHPVDHADGRWSDGYYQVKEVRDRPPGHYVGHSHIVRELVGGRMTHLHIDFKDPGEYLDTSRFKEAGVTACLAARVNIIDDPLAGDTAVGHLIHMVRERPGGQGSEMRSRFWMGDISKNSGGVLPAAVVNFVGNTRLGRYLRAPRTLGRDMHKHCFEEMRCLAHLLPDLYRQHHEGGDRVAGEAQ